MTAARFLEFCQRLLRDEGCPVVLIVDEHAAHKAKKVRAWVDSTQSRFTLAYLPAYSPFLNPDEWVWKNVKANRVGKYVVIGPDLQGPGGRRPAQATAPAGHRARLLRRPEPGLHQCDSLIPAGILPTRIPGSLPTNDRLSYWWAELSGLSPGERRSQGLSTPP